MKLPKINSLFPPRAGLKIVKGMIIKQLGFKFDDYRIVYYPHEEKLDYRIEGKDYFHDDDGKLARLIKAYAEAKLKTEDTLDVAIIDYREKDNCEAKIAYRDQKNEKQLLTIKF